MVEPLSTAISAIVGFGAAAVNNYFELKKQRENNEHEIKMHDRGLVEYQIKASDEEHKRLIEHDTAIEGLRASVRPILTYAFCSIAAILIIAGLINWIPGFDKYLGLNWLLNSATLTLSFWFGSRSMSKQRNRWFVKQ